MHLLIIFVVDEGGKGNLNLIIHLCVSDIWVFRVIFKVKTIEDLYFVDLSL